MQHVYPKKWRKIQTLNTKYVKLDNRPMQMVLYKLSNMKWIPKIL
jgi:hypothetical protein